MPACFIRFCVCGDPWFAWDGCLYHCFSVGERVTQILPFIVENEHPSMPRATPSAGGIPRGSVSGSFVPFVFIEQLLCARCWKAIKSRGTIFAGKEIVAPLVKLVV